MTTKPFSSKKTDKNRQKSNFDPKNKNKFGKNSKNKQKFDKKPNSQFNKKSNNRPQKSVPNDFNNEQFIQELADELNINTKEMFSNEQPKSKDKYQHLTGNDDIEDFGKVNYITVTRQQHDQRLDNFLLARLKGLPRSHVYNLIRSDEVRVNGKRAKAYDKLERGDIVRIAPVRLATREKPVISEDFAKGLLERIVYEDDGLIVLNKPSGMAVHGGSGESFGVIEAMREATGKKYLELVHRIDKDTSGLLMIAKKRSTLKVLQDHLREKTLQKNYLCIVTGWVKQDTQTIDKPLLKYSLANGERRVKVDDKAQINKESKPAQTQITVLSRFELDCKKVSLVKASPLTGRTHQIRVHMAYIGHALLGDDKYNLQDKSGVRRLCLHAYELHIPDYDVIKAELPNDLQSLIGTNFFDN